MAEELEKILSFNVQQNAIHTITVEKATRKATMEQFVQSDETSNPIFIGLVEANDEYPLGSVSVEENNDMGGSCFLVNFSVVVKGTNKTAAYISKEAFTGCTKILLNSLKEFKLKTNFIYILKCTCTNSKEYENTYTTTYPMLIENELLNSNLWKTITIMTEELESEDRSLALTGSVSDLYSDDDEDDKKDKKKKKNKDKKKKKGWK